MNKLMITAALCTGMLGAQAQTTPTDVQPTPSIQKPMHAQHNCMMATDKDWVSLGLNAEQTTKVKAIQDECKNECAVTAKDDATMSKIRDKHESRIMEVLTTAQHEKWMKWCADQPKMAKDPEPAPTEKM